MSTLLPANLLKLVVLAEVPRSVYLDAPKLDDAKNEKKRLDFFKMLRRGPAEQPATAPNVKTKSIHELNAAVWMRLTEKPSSPVALVLLYRDQKGEFAVMVDEVQVGESKSVMLSGNVTIEARGPIEYLRACVAGIEESHRYVIDEIYVQRVATEAGSAGQKRTA